MLLSLLHSKQNLDVYNIIAMLNLKFNYQNIQILNK